MNLSLQSIMDYQKCPMLYKFRYIDCIDVSVSEKRKVPNRWHIREQYDKSLHQVVYGMFHQLADNKMPTPYYIKQRWGIVWNKGRKKEDILFDTGSWRNEHRKLERSGLNNLLALHLDFQNVMGTPILIGKEYSLKLGKHTVTGTLDLVREVKTESGNPAIEIVDFKTDDKRMVLHTVGDMEVTAASLAFRQLFDYKEDQIMYYGMLSRKKTMTQRTETDYKLLERAVDHVAKAIDEGIFYPVLNSRCFECPFQKHCEKKEWF